MADDRFNWLQGFLWPKDDVMCRDVVIANLSDLDYAFSHVKDWRVAVQAGGNCGVWPQRMAGMFGTVYTFEPDPLNFHCLAHNCIDVNVIKFQAALGDHGEVPMSLATRPENCGAHFVEGDGTLPVIALDALNLQACGLIYLDVEGYEGHAIAGAEQTIQRCRPVIAIENKGLSEKYGESAEEVEAQILALGYRAVARPHCDVIFAPC